ncbi:MAG: hypothetical protein JNM56_20320 [Planctomycetia bacterium]|nr:hypothetical protein [Planctomycetia bacterium]
MRSQGLPITEIARRLGTSRQAVYALLKRCGPVRRLNETIVWTPEREALLGRVSDQGLARNCAAPGMR